MYLYIIIIFLLLFWAIKISNKNKKNAIVFSLFTLFFFIISDIYIVSNYYTWKWFNEAVLYQIFSWIKWAWIISNYSIIIFWFLFIILWITSSFFVYKYINKNINDNKTNYYINKFTYIFLILLILIHPLTNNILKLNWYYFNELLKSKTKEEIKFEDYYKIPSFQKANNKNKNIIFIYLESFENLYLDENIFPSLTNWLNNLKKQSIYFDNIKQWYWASWTIAWMVASQCWLPLISNFAASKSNLFLEKAVCMWDFLKYAWYNLNYIWWADLEFAWKWNFYKTHSFDSVEWKQELLNKLTTQNYFYDWWLYDDTIFDLAYEKYEKLSQNKEKFGLFLLNMDTHWDKWVLSKNCENLKYSEEDSILNSYHCTDYLVSNFVNKIINNKNFKNTSIVIASDHLAMNNNNSTKELNKYEDKRNLLFFIIDSENKKYININKDWNTQDIWATVLWNLWFDVEQLGIWFNLLKENNFTITKQNPNIIFGKWNENYESFWWEK